MCLHFREFNLLQIDKTQQLQLQTLFILGTQTPPTKYKKCGINIHEVIMILAIYIMRLQNCNLFDEGI